MNTKKTLRTMLMLSVLLLFSIVYKNSPLYPEADKSVQGAQTESGGLEKVARVIDGDTIEMEDKERIRLIGINAPENSQPNAHESKKKLEDLVLGREVEVKTDVAGTDSYGRTLAYIYSGTTFVNYEMIKSGLAVTETVPPNVSFAQTLVEAQSDAKKNCAGMWEGLCNPGDTSCVQISTVQKDGKDKNDEWVELVNTCQSKQNLEGYLIKDNSASNSYVFGKSVLNPKASVRLHTGCGVNSSSDVYWKCPEQANFVWNNNTDRAYLYDDKGVLISEVGY